MYRIFLIVLLSTFLGASETLLPESTVAVVNGTAITVDERDKEVGKLLPKEYFHSALSDEKLEDLRKKAVENLIDKTLLYKYAISKNIKTTDDEIDDVMTNLAARLGSKKRLEEAITQLGFTKKSFREAVRKDETLKKLYAKEIESDPSEKELKSYYENNMYKFEEPEKIKASLIYVRNNPSDPDGKEKAKKKIGEAMTLIEGGENFAYVAQEYSDDPSRVMGGSMGYIHKGMLDPAVEEEAFSLDANKTSSIIEKDIGYFIVKVDEKTPKKQLSFDQIKNKLKRELKEKDEERRKAELLGRLKKKSIIVK